VRSHARSDEKDLLAGHADAANNDRETCDGVKVGGHQASGASLVIAMTALWFAP